MPAMYMGGEDNYMVLNIQSERNARLAEREEPNYVHQITKTNRLASTRSDQHHIDTRKNKGKKDF